MIKNYVVKKSKDSMAKLNGLVPVQSKYYSGSDLYYDFELFDSLSWTEPEKEAVKADIMEHHAVSWFNQPMPTLIIHDSYTHYVGQINTVCHRVYKPDGKRMMVIVEVTSVHIEKQVRKSIYDHIFQTIEVFDAKTNNFAYDIEMEAMA